MAVIEATEAGGTFSENSTWVGGVKPGTADDVVFGAKSGNVTATALINVNSIASDPAYKNTFALSAGTTNKLQGKNAAGYMVQWRGGTFNRGSAATIIETLAEGTFKFLSGGQTFCKLTCNMATTGSILIFEDSLTGSIVSAVRGKVTGEGRAISLEKIESTGTNAKAFELLNCEIKLSGTTTVFNFGSSATLTLTMTGTRIELTDTTATVKTMKMNELASGNLGTIKLSGGASTPVYRITESPGATIENLEATEGQKMTFELTNLVGVKVNLMTGWRGTPSNIITIKCFTVGGNAQLIGPGVETLVCNGDYLSIKDNTSTTGLFYAGRHSTNVSNVSNWKFEAPVHVLTATQTSTVVPPVKKITRVLSAEQSSTVVPPVKTITRVLSASQSQSATVTRKVTRVLSASQTQSATIVHTVKRVLSASQTQSATIEHTVIKAGAHEHTLSADQTSSAASFVTPGRVLAATQSTSASIVRSLTRTLSASQTSEAVIVRSLSRNLSASQSSSASVARTVGPRLLSASQTSTAAAFVTPTRVLSASQSQSASVVRSLARTLSASQAQEAAILRAPVTRVLSASQTSEATVTITAPGHVSHTLSASTTSSATIRRDLSRVMSASSSPTASIRRTISRNLSATVTATATVRTSPTRVLSTEQTSTASITVAHTRSHTLSASQTTLAAIRRAIARNLTASQASTATVVHEGTVFEGTLLLSEASVGPDMLTATTVEPSLLLEASVD